MITVKNKIGINQDDIHLRIKAEVGGRVVYHKKANSLTSNFLVLMANYMTQFNGFLPSHVEGELLPIENSSNLDTQTITGAQDKSMTRKGFQVNGSITTTNDLYQDSVQTEIGSSVLWTHSSSLSVQERVRSTTFVRILTSPYKGIYEVDSIEILSTTETRITLKDITFAEEVSISINSGKDMNVANYETNISDGGGIHSIDIGRSTTPVNIDDAGVYDEIKEDEMTRSNSPGSMSIGTPVITLEESIIPITQVFTNVSGGNIQISEMCLNNGFRGGSGNYDYTYLVYPEGADKNISRESTSCVGAIARDVIDPIQVADGETVSITYEIVCSVVPNVKGVLAGFNELMYRILSGSSRTVRDYFNIDRDHGRNQSSMVLHRFPPYVTENQSYMGIQLGHGTDGVDIDNTRLISGTGQDTRISAGSYAGALHYFGTTLARGEKISDNEKHLVFEAFFENKTSENITVRETGFNVSTTYIIGSGASSRTRHAVVCISRHILDTEVVVEPGKVLKIEYIFAISTGS